MTREFIKSGERVVKVGRTADPDRIKGYPKGSMYIMLSFVADMYEAESQIIAVLDSRGFSRRLDFGLEYFEGDVNTMHSAVLTMMASRALCEVEHHHVSMLAFYNDSTDRKGRMKDRNAIAACGTSETPVDVDRAHAPSHAPSHAPAHAPAHNAPTHAHAHVPDPAASCAAPASEEARTRSKSGKPLSPCPVCSRRIPMAPSEIMRHCERKTDAGHIALFADAEQKCRGRSSNTPS